MGGPNVTGIMQMVQQMQDREKQITALGKSADYFVQANPTALDDIGVHPDAWKNLGARDKASAVQGYLQAQASKKEQADLAEQQRQSTAGETFRNAITRLRLGGQQGLDVASAPAPVLKMLGQMGFGGMDQVGEELQNQTPFQPGADNILQAGLESGVDPSKVATLADSMARIQSFDRRKTKDNLQFVKSPTGATVALSADTGAFQYDPFSKAQAEAGALSKKDAIKAYNDNQGRINQIRTQVKLAKDPANSNLWDTDALQAELDDLEGQQPELKRLTGLAAKGQPPAAAPASVTKKRRYNPATGKIE